MGDEADRPAWIAVSLLALAVGCGGARVASARSSAGPSELEGHSSAEPCELEARFPVRPCQADVDVARVGVWQDDEGWAFVYDGCEVAFNEFFYRDYFMFRGLRNIARATVVDVREFGDPPYYRTRAEWRGDVLVSVSIIGDRELAVWNGGAMCSPPTLTLHRVTELRSLSRSARRLLCVDERVPTEAELARELGLPMPTGPEPPPDPIQDIMCPTRTCGR